MVFKKFTDRLTNAATSAASNASNTLWYGRDQAEKISQLESMGFTPQRARHALNATEGDVDRAAELLLLSADGDAGSSNGEVGDTAAVAATRLNSNNNHNNTTNHGEGQHVASHNDEQMRRAIEESLRVNQDIEERQLRQAEVASMNNAPTLSNATPANKKTGATKTKTTAMQQKPIPPKQPPLRSAAAINAGKAATSRHANNGTTKSAATTLTTAKATLDHTHPHVKIPDKLQNKSKEEQILRCADRVKPHVMAVDTLLRVLNSVKNSPDTMKFRCIDRANANYITHVRDKPGAEDMLLAMNYRRNSNHKNELVLERYLVDDALLYLGISALEQVRESLEYKEAKKWRAFHSEMRRVAKMNGSEMNLSEGMTQEETEIRLAFLSKCPKEPPEGRGAWMYVYLGEEKEKIDGGYVSRRFDGDDILSDVLHWLGGCYGNELLDKIHSREWCLCDTNRYPILPLDVEKHGKKTLQYLGLFPSGKLGVRLSEDGWRNGEEAGGNGGSGPGMNVVGSSRGLGAASSSMLH